MVNPSEGAGSPFVGGRLLAASGRFVASAYSNYPAVCLCLSRNQNGRRTALFRYLDIALTAGYPAAMSKGVDELARDHGPRAVEVLADMMETAMEPRDVIRAAEAILDRGYGKPSQAIIAIPANRRQAALLAGMSDEQLVAVIEQKQLPRLSRAQPLITVPRGTSSHGPADSFPDIDPLLA